MAHEPFLAGNFNNLTSLLSDMTKKEETFHNAKLFKVLIVLAVPPGTGKVLYANSLGAFSVEQLSDEFLENSFFLTGISACAHEF